MLHEVGVLWNWPWKSSTIIFSLFLFQNIISILYVGGSTQYVLHLNIFVFVDLGEWDGAGVVVKTKLRNEQLRNPTRMLQNAGNVVEFLEETLSD
jgi:hypothetical protein